MQRIIRRLWGLVKRKALDYLDTTEIPTVVLLQKLS